MARRKVSGRTANQFLNIDLDAAEFVSLKEVFRSLPDAMRRQVLKPIVDKVAKVGAQVAKQTAARMLPPRVSNPNRYSGKPRWNRPTGALRDSLGAKTVPLSKMRDKNKVVGMFGARRDFRVSKQTAKRAASIGMKVQRPNLMQRKFRVRPNPFIVPARYIHLVEFGHKGSAHYPPARPYPFLQEASRRLGPHVPAMIRQFYSAAHESVFNAAIRRAKNPNRRSFVRRARA